MDKDHLRQALFDCDGHALVMGGPGSGKTTLALRKAVRRIQAGLEPGQSILFLSFSRSAVARVAEATQAQVPAEHRNALSMQTFHSFFWEMLLSNAYLLGSPKPLRILLPPDEEVLFGKIKKKDRKPENPQWQAWLAERSRLFFEEGRMAFELFFPSALSLIQRCFHIRRMIAQRHPLIIVDEAQDTNGDAWNCIELLAETTTIICLADLEQQIFDYLPGIGPERIAAIRAALSPLEIDLAGENHRSPDSEIVDFAQDILNCHVRKGTYKGVSTFPYNPKAGVFNPHRTYRMALGALYRRIKAQTGEWARSIAILTHSGFDAAKISAALNSDPKPVKHKLLFDENVTLLAARIAAFLLEPKSPAERLTNLATAVEMFRDIERSRGTAKAAELQKWTDKIRVGKIPSAAFIKELVAIVDSLSEFAYSGDPAKDWNVVRNMLRAAVNPQLKQVATHLDYLVAFNRGKRIREALAEIWEIRGQYVGAREAFNSALAQDQLLGGADDPRGIQIMTIHKAKGKQFDGVIIVRNGRFDEVLGQMSSFIWRDDTSPYNRSRRILRVGITRARIHTMILDPLFPKCPIISGYTL